MENYNFMKKAFQDPITEPAANPYIRGVAAGFDISLACIPAYFMASAWMRHDWSLIQGLGGNPEAQLQNMTLILKTFLIHLHVFLLLVLTLNVLHGILLEGSFRQATLGKQLLKLRVENMNSTEDLTLKQATLRILSGSLSWITLNLGHGFAWWRKDRRMLHDVLTSTTVIQDEPLTAQDILTKLIPMLALPIFIFILGIYELSQALVPIIGPVMGATGLGGMPLI